MGKLLRYFQSTGARNIAYAAVMLLTIVSAGAAFVWAILFHIRLVNSLIFIAEEAIPTSSFNLVDFAQVGSKLGIKLPEPTPTAPPQTIEEPIATTTAISEATSTEAVAATSSPAEQEEILPKDVSIQLLNGTFIVGLAKVWQERLAAAGFENITTGNAAQRNYVGVSISYKPSKQNILPQIEQAFDALKTEITNKEEVIEDAEYDVVIILGK